MKSDTEFCIIIGILIAIIMLVQCIGFVGAIADDGAKDNPPVCEQVCPPRDIIIIDRQGNPVFIPKGSLIPENYYTPEQYREEAAKQREKKRQQDIHKDCFDPKRTI